MRIVLIPDWYIFARLCLKRICQSRYFAALYQGAWFFIFHQNKAILICVALLWKKNEIHYWPFFVPASLKAVCMCQCCCPDSIEKHCTRSSLCPGEPTLPICFKKFRPIFLILCFRLVFWHDMKKSTCVIELGRALGQPISYWGYNFFLHKCRMPQKQSCLCDNRFVIHHMAMAWSWQIKQGGELSQCTLASRKHVLINGFHGKLLFEEIDAW